MFMNRAEGYDLRGTYIKKQKNSNKKTKTNTVTIKIINLCIMVNEVNLLYVKN